VNRTVARNAVDLLEAELLKKFGSPKAAMAALGFGRREVTRIVSEGREMTRRRLAHDQMPETSEQAIEQIAQIFEALPDDEAETLADELEARLDDTGPAADQSFRRGRRARDSSDPADQFRSASTGSKLDGVGVPNLPRAALDRNRRLGRDRRRIAADTGAGSPIPFEKIFPGAAAKSGGGAVPAFDDIFPGTKR
jgi:uncharacterized protein YcgL (UPF0745 family)